MGDPLRRPTPNLGSEVRSLVCRLGEIHPRNTFPAEVLLELAAEAIVESGATQVEPIEYEGMGGGGQGQGEAGQTAADLIRD